jgi:hypothetical protein
LVGIGSRLGKKSVSPDPDRSGTIVPLLMIAQEIGKRNAVGVGIEYLSSIVRPLP